jgi:CPA1 family monovalent cation:H+ antiporter
MPGGAPFPGRHLLIFLATAVIVVSLVLASVGLPHLLEGLELPEETGEQAEEDHARHAATVAAIAAIDQASRARDGDQALAEVRASAAEQVMGLYQHRLGVAQARAEGARASEAEQAERAYRLAGLKGERDTILQLARERRISDATARKLLHEIDLVEARYR